MKCDNCNYEIDDDSKYCCNCGAKIKRKHINKSEILELLSQNKIILLISTGIVLIIIILALYISLYIKTEKLKNEIKYKNSIIEDLKDAANEDGRKIEELKGIIEEKEKKEIERISLPKCDDTDVVWSVINIFDKKYNDKKSDPILTRYGTSKYTQIDVLFPTITKFDENLPRYECKGQLEYDYIYTPAGGVPKKPIHYKRNVTYSISKSGGKPVIYADFN